MKKQTKTPTSVIRNASIKVAMFCLLMVPSFGLLHAQLLLKSPSADVRYVGVAEDKLVFEVAYQNDAETNFVLEIRDANGYELYSARFKQKNFRKRYAISKYELGNNSLTFVVASRGNIVQQEFDVNANSRLIEEISVVKL